MFYIELSQNAALLLAVCFLQRFIVERWPHDELHGRIASGVLFGLTAILAMSLAIEVRPGVIFDSRTIVLSMGALFGGPIAGAISFIIAGAYRLWLGGDGMWIGFCVVLLSVVAGLVFHQTWRDRLPRDITLVHLFIVGIIVHVIAVGLFYFLPLDYVDVVLKKIAGPYISLLTLTTVAMGLLLRELGEIGVFDAILGESEARFRTLFASAAVPLIEEDISKVFLRLEELRADGVTDLRAHLKATPGLRADLEAAVKVIDANSAAQRLFRVNSVRRLRTNISTYFGDHAEETFVDALCALWRGDERFEGVAEFAADDGTTRICIISLPLPKTLSDSRRIPVCIVDITAQRESARQLAEERRRLEEILWGTNVGTWEWNVQTGELTINGRWAEIAGYTLDELTPVSIQTWIDLAHPDDYVESNRQLQRVFERTIDYYDCEVRMRHKDGHWIWVQDRGKIVEWAGNGKPLRMSGTHTDVTERKQAEARAARMNAVRNTLLHCHAVILEETDERRLYQRVSDILVETQDYALVWIGRPADTADKVIEPVVRAGNETAYLDSIAVSWADDDLGQGPAGLSVKTGKVQVVHNLQGQTGFRPWAASAKDHNLKSVMSAPIRAGERTIAVLNVYSYLENAFDNVEIDLVSEFAGNIGLAVEAIRLSHETKSLHSALEDAAFGAVRAIAATIEKRDPYTSGHQENVATISVAIARKLGWAPDRIDGLRLGATIHDIGKIYIPAEILNRPGRLTDSEFGLIKSHPQVGYEILENTSFPWPIKEMVVQHHERLDGTGYPSGLKGDEIIEEAKIIAVADVVDAITSHRPYRPGKGVDVALAEIERGRGTAYDPAVVDICLRMIRDDGFRWGDFRN